MSFKKPFRAEPVILGEYARAKEARSRRVNQYRLAGLFAVVTLLVFLVGMAITNWETYRPQAPVYYSSCVAAGKAGAAPMTRGTPGYRSKLDEDNDGVACEGFGG